MASRRQTLGLLSPSQLNSQRGAQGSQQAARILTASKDGNASVPPKTRKSMAPSAMGAGAASLLGVDHRRSSAFPSSGPKQDPRPLADKGFQNDCIRTIITYLSSHGYPAAVSPKTLSSPTGKDFTMIAQFLFQRFDPSMRQFGKMEDEVTTFFKRLNYPFPISKSALFAVGSPHSWPSVLAALTWLVELLNYSEKVDQSESAGVHTSSTHAGTACKPLLHGAGQPPLTACAYPTRTHACRPPGHRGG
jgi:kinetochore protein NDC80